MVLFNHELLSLKNLAFRRLVANVCMESSVLLSVSKYQNRYSPYDADDEDLNSQEYQELLSIQKVWKDTVEDKIECVISKLRLPKVLSQESFDIIGPMGLQVKKWKEFHEYYLNLSHRELRYFDVPVLEKMRWTAWGTVDYRETAIAIINSDVLSIDEKFKFACLYCLEDYIPTFWRDLPTRNKKYFYSVEVYRLRTGGLGQEFWWPYITQEQESKLDELTTSYRTNGVTFHQYAFLHSVLKGNKIAAEHFLRKLTSEEKSRSLVSAARLIEKRSLLLHANYLVFPVKKCFELLGYLISIMTPDQQKQILRERPLAVLEVFLNWPRQDTFLKIARNIAQILSDDRRLDGVLFFMYENYERFGQNPLESLQEFFSFIRRKRPEFWLGFVNRQSEPYSYFRDKFIKRGAKPLEMCFRSLDADAGKKLIFSEAAINVFKKLISEGKPEAVEACLRDASLSKEEKKALKEALRVKGIGTRKRSGLVKLLADDS